jgi:hypothetical protein
MKPKGYKIFKKFEIHKKMNLAPPYLAKSGVGVLEYMRTEPIGHWWAVCIGVLIIFRTMGFLLYRQGDSRDICTDVWAIKFRNVTTE